MIQPIEMKTRFPMNLTNGIVSTTTTVWETLTASRKGNLEQIEKLVAQCPELLYAQYNYTPPIHFAVREGHLDLVRYLLNQGALDPSFKTYPFKDSLLTLAHDRGYQHIVVLLQEYLNEPARFRFKGDCGEIDYGRSNLEQEFENAVDKEDLDKTEQFLKDNPDLVLDETFFWGEGILMMPSKDGNLKLIELLMRYGAKVPHQSKWGRFYYFKHFEIAALLLENGMNPDHMTWHHVTLLHDMAQEGDIQKACLLLQYNAAMNTVEEEYQSTPLGLAARWGNLAMAEFLLNKGADPNKAGATWATPLAWAIKKEHNEIENLLRKAGAQ